MGMERSTVCTVPPDSYFAGTTDVYEALGLTIGGVDLPGAILTIRDSKFIFGGGGDAAGVDHANSRRA
jgi:hypothetical protein